MFSEESEVGADHVDLGILLIVVVEDAVLVSAIVVVRNLAFAGFMEIFGEAARDFLGFSLRPGFVFRFGTLEGVKE